MSMAIDEAWKAYKFHEVPVGAVVVDESGKLLAKGHNLKESTYNPCGHAEVLTLIEAAKDVKNWRLVNASLYVTLEPCVMCMGAIIHARIKNLVFGAYDMKGGIISLGYNFHQNKKLNHQINVMGGIMHYECSSLLSKFFKEKRNVYKNFS